MISLIVQLPRDGALDRYLRAYPPPSVTSGQVTLEHIAGDAAGRLGPPEAGQVVMSVLSPEALRDGPQVQDVVRHAAGASRLAGVIVTPACSGQPAEPPEAVAGRGVGENEVDGGLGRLEPLRGASRSADQFRTGTVSEIRLRVMLEARLSGRQVGESSGVSSSLS